MTSVLMVAGEASGDRHGARLLSELRRLIPEVEAFGLGGEELRAAGFEALADSSEIAVVGLFEALGVLRRAHRIQRQLVAVAARRRPQAAVLIDSPDFNLPLARKLKRLGIPVAYYVSPQVWAWRRGRIAKIAERVDLMLVFFAFEEELYRQRGLDVVHVGHPLLDEIPPLEHVWDAPDGGGEPRRLALLPGSRRSEVETLLPTMLEAAATIAARRPVEIRLIRAATVPDELVSRCLAGVELPAGTSFEIVSDDRFRCLADAHLALCASGTATLELALLGTPMLVLYRLKRWTYWLARLLVKLPSISLVNLVLGRSAVPELLQADASPERVADEACELLASPRRIAKMRSSLAEVRERLGERGASGRAAKAVVRLLAPGARAA